MRKKYVRWRRKRIPHDQDAFALIFFKFFIFISMSSPICLKLRYSNIINRCLRLVFSSLMSCLVLTLTLAHISYKCVYIFTHFVPRNLSPLIFTQIKKIQY